MTRFASAAPATRAGLVAAAVLAGLVLFAVGALTISLIGLGRFSAEIDPVRVPAWFFYYRHDPEVRRWFAVGAGSMGWFC